MKTTFKCEESKKLIYRNYSNLSKYVQNMSREKIIKPNDKTKICRGNHKPHFNKTLRKAIMKRTVKRFSSHPSIIKIKHKFKLNKKFSFQCVSEDTVRKVMKSLSSDKWALLAQTGSGFSNF